MILALLLAANTLSYDVLISAGHEGRPASCAHFPQHHCNLGAAGERDWTPVVADAATAILRRHGVSVARLPADFDGSYKVDAAVFIHFDGASPPCSSAASIGYAKNRMRLRQEHGGNYMGDIGCSDSSLTTSQSDCGNITLTNKSMLAMPRWSSNSVN